MGKKDLKRLSPLYRKRQNKTTHYIERGTRLLLYQTDSFSQGPLWNVLHSKLLWLLSQPCQADSCSTKHVKYIIKNNIIL